MEQSVIVSDFKSSQCRCGDTKKPNRSFCYSCWGKLSRQTQLGLYRKFGEGYEEFYREAVAFLFNDSYQGQHP